MSRCFKNSMCPTPTPEDDDDDDDVRKVIVGITSKTLSNTKPTHNNFKDDAVENICVELSQDNFTSKANLDGRFKNKLARTKAKH